MARTLSTMLPLGTIAPDFRLLDVTTGATLSLDSFSGTPLLVMFICRHCPYVKHVQDELARIGRDYRTRGLSILAIGSNDIQVSPDDSPKGLAEQAVAAGFTFPYAYDETQDVAKAYTAACTPDFFLFDEGLRLVYRGQLDDSRPSNGKPVTGIDLRAAVDAAIAGRPVSGEQHPSSGCNIKWKPGLAPAYFPH